MDSDLVILLQSVMDWSSEEDRARIGECIETVRKLEHDQSRIQKLEADKARLDKLQRLTKEYGRGWILRESSTGRGMRLHETFASGAFPNVRTAIDAFREQRDGMIDESVNEILLEMEE